MNRGLYDLLGAAPDATLDDLRTAYTRATADLHARRSDAQHLHRVRLDEAWQILSDPLRRRRYDAFLALQERREHTDAEGLWQRAAGALVPPATVAATEYLRATTTLRVGDLPEAPRPRGSAPLPVHPDDEPTLIETRVPLTSATSSPPPPPRQRPDLRVVDGAEATPVLVLPRSQLADGPAPVSAEDIARLVDRHGWSGGLLRAVRELRGLSLDEISDSTRITLRYLEALEREEQDVLPSATFVRGYLREVARVLQLDADTLVAGYWRRG